MHDPRVGRFLSIDPLAATYPWNSPYTFAENKVIQFIELEGLETAESGAGSGAVIDYLDDDDPRNPEGVVLLHDFTADVINNLYGMGKMIGTLFKNEDGLGLVHLADQVEHDVEYTYNNFSAITAQQDADRKFFSGVATGLFTDGLIRSGPFRKAAAPQLKVAATTEPMGGRLGNAVTREHVAATANEMEARGWEITGGGGRLPEEYIPGPGGGRAGSSYPDITAIKEGRTLRVNTVDTNANGSPTMREMTNETRIRAQ